MHRGITLGLAVACVACSGRTARPVAPSLVPETSPPSRPARAEPREEPTSPEGPRVVFLERDDRSSPWTPVRDATRLAALRERIDNEPARLALALYGEAWRLAPPSSPAEPTLFIGLEPDGNHMERGLELVEDGRRTSLPTLPYLRLADDPAALRGTLLHETGHAIHALLAGDAAPDDGVDRTVAAIPHSTAAVTDRSTAFAEGLAIHLETVNGHCGTDPATRAEYDHAALVHGPSGDRRSEYYFGVRDLMTYAQGFSRYQAVRDGMFAFEPAARGDYLRVQLDPARDLRALRAPGALVASEGFVASVLFQVIAREGCAEDLLALLPRYRPLLAALHRAAHEPGPLDEIPLLDLVATMGPEAIAAFLDLSRGVTVDGEAAAQWAALYDAALRVDVGARNQLSAALEQRRTGWRDEAVADPTRLAARIGPVVVVVVPAVTVELVAFGSPQPLSFDVNAAGAPMLALVPGWTAAHVAAVLAERERAPFRDLDDLRTRLRSRRIPTRALRGRDDAPAR